MPDALTWPRDLTGAMTSVPVDAANAYQAPAQSVLNTAVWNAVMQSIHQRITAREALEATFEQLIANGTGLALQTIADNVGPQIAALSATIASLNANVALAEDRVAILVAGNINAANVLVTAIPGLTGANVQAALEALDTRTDTINSNITSINTTTSSINSNITTINGNITTLTTSTTFTEITGNRTLSSNPTFRNLRLRATSGNNIIGLPTSPPTGFSVRIVDGESIGNGATYTVVRSGQNIMGLAEDMVLDVPGIDMMLWYNGTEWRLF